ncbi:UPF0488 protein C8orf33 homolog [Pempheris klunzingeri]|uniref:UPF0488 protein C8orf33 homolog n=1 Tax=Pempheris klunzingeri TaxID=3127111 RepID=UPI003980A912
MKTCNTGGISMTEQKLMFLDIEPKSNRDDRAERPLWTRTDNSFRFDFHTDNSPALQEEAPPSSERTEPSERRISFAGQASAFAFNFQIPPVTPAENMETAETPDTSSPGSRRCVQEEKPPLPQEVNSPPEPPVQTKAKKKKKKKTPSDGSEPQQKPSSAEGSPRGEDTELSAEEQLNKQLDWCIEQLESAMRSQKGTPKQKEEASRALKTLRSSKAPLVKKRQVMRAMVGDYRKKMEEERNKQYKMIQSEIASAQVKVVSDFPKKCVFHRRAEVKTQTATFQENPQQTEAQDSDPTSQTQRVTSAFVLTPAKEEFRFNFL